MAEVSNDKRRTDDQLRSARSLARRRLLISFESDVGKISG